MPNNIKNLDKKASDEFQENITLKKKYYFCFDEDDLDHMESLGPRHGSISENVMLLSLVRNLSKRYGHCSPKNSFLSSQIRSNEKTISRMLGFLEEHKLIYRNEWMTQQGKKRHIIVREEAIKYRDNFLNRSSVPDEVMKKFCEFFGLSHQTIPLRTRNSNKVCNGQIVHSDATDKLSHASLLRKDIHIKQNNKPTVVVSFIDSVVSELVKTFPDHDKSLIENFVKRKQADLEKMDSPVGYCRNAIKQGALSTAEKQAKSEKQQQQNVIDIERNKLLAQFYYKSNNKFSEEFAIYCDEFSIRFTYKRPTQKIIAIPFNDPNFIDKFNLQKEKLRKLGAIHG